MLPLPLIINKVIKDRGGLHNRVNTQIYLMPFTLKECEEYLQSRNIRINRYQILTLYMVMGGPAYYWSLLQRGKSAAQNIDNLFFAENGKLRGEYSALYESLFKNPDRYIKIVEALGDKAKGLTRQELIDDYGLENSGVLPSCLEELEQCAWRSDQKNLGPGERGAQIDLLIDRRDDTINICEMKWAAEPYVIDKDYDEKLRNKVAAFIRETGTRKSILISMVTTYGVKENMYSDAVQSRVVMDDLFA